MNFGRTLTSNHPSTNTFIIAIRGKGRAFAKLLEPDELTYGGHMVIQLHKAQVFVQFTEIIYMLSESSKWPI